MRRLAGRGAALLLAAMMWIGGSGAQAGETIPLTILHWNDYHSQNVSLPWITEGDTTEIGGAATLAGYLNHYRDQYERTLELHAGDEFQGTPISAITEGRSQVELLNRIRPDAFAVGNHEFDYGTESLVQRLSEAQFPVLLANVKREDTGERLFPPDTVLTVDGVRVGIVSVMTRRFREVTTKKATAGLMVTPAAEAVRASMERIAPISDVQIVLSHMGFWEDSLLAQDVGAPVDLIIGGHSHTLLRELKWINGVGVAQAGDKGRWLGIMELEVDTAADRVTVANYKVQPVLAGVHPVDTEVAEIVRAQEARLAAEMDKVIATLKTDWEREYRGESNLGNWVTDGFRWKTGADLGFMNSGGLRADVKAGPLTVREVFQVSPFGNELVRFTLTGEQLKQVARHKAASSGGFLQVSGLRLEAEGGDVISLTVDGDSVQDDATYSAVTVNYVMDHFKRFFGLEPSSVTAESLYLVDREVLLEYAREQGTIASEVEGRLRISWPEP